MITNKFKGTFLALVVTASLSPAIIPATAYAYDDDVDIVCDTDGDGKDYCVTVDQLKAECPIVDPENELDICAGLNESKRLPGGIRSFKADKGLKTVPLSQVKKFKMK